MAKPKRRARPVGSPDKVTLVRAVQNFTAMTSAQCLLSSNQPDSHDIPKGTIGILRGPCCGAPHLRLVDFEHGGTDVVSVEVWPEQIEALPM